MKKTDPCRYCGSTRKQETGTMCPDCLDIPPKGGEQQVDRIQQPLHNALTNMGYQLGYYDAQKEFRDKIDLLIEKWENDKKELQGLPYRIKYHDIEDLRELKEEL